MFEEQLVTETVIKVVDARAKMSIIICVEEIKRLDSENKEYLHCITEV